MIYDLANFDNLDSLTQCYHPEDNITIADRSIILLKEIGTITLTFYTKNSIEKKFFSKICYCNKLNTKLISLEMLNLKSLSFFFLVGYLRYEIENYQLY